MTKTLLLEKLPAYTGKLDSTCHQYCSHQEDGFGVMVTNHTAIFKKKFRVSGTDCVVRHPDIADMLDYLKQKTLRKQLSYLEEAVIFGKGQCKGIVGFVPGHTKGPCDVNLIKNIYDLYESRDLVVLPSSQSEIRNQCEQKGMNAICCNNIGHHIYMVLSSKLITIVPLSGRSFYYKPLASDDDYEQGMIIGEYTLEVKDPLKHEVVHITKSDTKLPEKFKNGCIEMRPVC